MPPHGVAFLQIAPAPASLVASIPNSPNWIAGGRGLLYAGSLEAGQALIYDGYEWLKGVHALDAKTLVMTEGRTVIEVKYPELEISRRHELPPVPDAWRHAFAGARDVFALASGSRLSVFGSAEKSEVVAARLDSPDSFTAVEVLPQSRRLVVGRGDGRIEVRDSQTLEVKAVFRPLMKDATCLCALNEELVAVSDGDRTTTLLSLSSGSLERLDYQDVVIGLHRLSDERLVVVCPRRILVYAGKQREREADLASQLPGIESFRRSALSGESLLLASETRGVFKISVADLPPVAAPDPSIARAADLLAQLEKALTAKAGIREALSALVQLDDKKAHVEGFEALYRHRVALDSAELRLHLRSTLPSVRRQALRHMTQFAERFSGMAEEVKPLLGDADDDIQYRAISVLGRLKDPVAVEWLQPLRGGTDRFITDEVERVLKELTQQ